MDTYGSYIALSQNEALGQDFAILCRRASGSVVVMAIHGGGIEPGTGELAEAVAGEDYGCYVFKGLKKSGNSTLHISSNSYDEPQGVQLAAESRVVLSIHGCRGAGERVFVGGRNRRCQREVVQALVAAGFASICSEVPGQRGLDPRNICNRCRGNAGVQLEITRGLRDRMFEHLDQRSSRRKTPVFFAFVACLRDVLWAWSDRR